ncbi:MAG: NAD-dependent epimerase/dehydratase family protein [Gemmatimonadota bacterium]
MRLLFTGATGFVGSHLVEAATALPLGGLQPRTAPELRVLVRPTSDLSHLEGLDVERFTGQLGDAASLREATSGVDVVLHLAALTRAKTEEEFRAANETGTRSLLEAAVNAGSCRRFVYVSSLAAVGPAVEGRPVTASDPPRPLTAYGRSKLAGERACEEAAGDMDVLILRPPAVYGPRDKDLLTFFSLAARGILPVPSGPPRPLQMIFVSDLAQAILAAAYAEDVHGIYHAADPKAFSWAEVLDLIARAVGKKGRRIPVPQSLLRIAGEVNGALGRAFGRPQIFDGDKVRELLAPGWLCETDRATKDLGFTAATPLGLGLRQTAEWYRKEGWLP